MLKYFLLFVLLLNIYLTAYSRVRVCTNDYPPTQLVGAVANLFSSNFIVSKRKYISCMHGFILGKVDMMPISSFDYVVLSLTTNMNAYIIANYSDASDSGFLALRNNYNIGPKSLPLFALQADSAAFLYLITYLRNTNQKIQNINILNVKNENLPNAFSQNKKLSGVFGWNPSINQAHLDVNSTLIPIKSNLYTFIIVQKKSYDEKKVLYKSFLEKWSQYINTPDTIKFVSKETNMENKLTSDLLFKFIPTIYKKEDLKSALKMVRKYNSEIKSLILEDKKVLEKTTGTKVIKENLPLDDVRDLL